MHGTGGVMLTQVFLGQSFLFHVTTQKMEVDGKMVFETRIETDTGGVSDAGRTPADDEFSVVFD